MGCPINLADVVVADGRPEPGPGRAAFDDRELFMETHASTLGVLVAELRERGVSLVERIRPEVVVAEKNGLSKIGAAVEREGAKVGHQSIIAARVNQRRGQSCVATFDCSNTEVRRAG